MEKESKKKANKYAKRLRKTAKEPCVKKMPSKMKKAYLRAAENHYAQVSGKTIYMWDYYLSDIDNDEKAELFIKYGTCEADMQLLVYQYIEEEAVMVDSVYCTHSTLCAYKNNEGIIMYESHMGGEAIYLLTLENGKIKSKIIGGRYVDTGDYITLKGVLKSHVFYNKNWKKTVRYYDLISI